MNDLIRPRVLVIDDDSSVRLMVRECLAPTFEVTEAVNGEEGMERYHAARPDLVLLDLVMPGIDGYEVCLRLRAEKSSREMPIVMLTGLDSVESIERAYEVGATDFITKPIPWLVLSHRVRFVLRAADIMRELNLSETRMANAQRVAQLGSWNWNPDDNRVRFSDEARRILGIADDAEDATPTVLLDAVPPGDRERLRNWLDDSLLCGEAGSIEHALLPREEGGAARFVRQRAEVLHDPSGRPKEVDIAIFDITEWRQAEAQVQYQIDHDALTGLENRRCFGRRLEEALARAHQTRQKIAVLSVDLDRFKQINESLGHHIGDVALRQVAGRLQRCLRGADLVAHPGPACSYVARVGGDEFTILLENLGRVQDAAKVAWRIVDSFAEPITCEGRELFLTTSIGIAVYPNDEVAPDALLQSADAAMNHAKAQGRNTAQFCSPFMNSVARERLQMETHLRRALERDELEIYYQPKISLQSGQMTGMEALLRWHHPELGIVSPGGFIPIAEETGLIIPMSDWLLQTVCKQARLWDDHPPCRISVNLAAQQFTRSDAVKSVANALEQTGVDPRWLEIELTEGTLMVDTDATIQALREIKKLGVTIAIDDFGTGFSSLSYLMKFPVDVLKIDRAFISELPHDPHAVAITAAIIGMGHSLGFQVVAEGVETEEQLRFLEEQGCDQYQGFLFSPPVPVDIVSALLGEVAVPT